MNLTHPCRDDPVELGSIPMWELTPVSILASSTVPAPVPCLSLRHFCLPIPAPLALVLQLLLCPHPLPPALAGGWEDSPSSWMRM